MNTYFEEHLRTAASETDILNHWYASEEVIFYKWDFEVLLLRCKVIFSILFQLIFN